MIQLYGRGQSRSFRGVWAMLECGLPFEYIHVEKSSPPVDYENLNSQLKVPTMTDGDLVLVESAAIVNYAGMKSEKLIPRELAACAAYDNLCYFILTDLEQPLWTIGKHQRLLPEALRCEAVLETAAWEFAKAQKALLALLGDRSLGDSDAYALGDTFTLADVLLGQTLNWAERFGQPLDQDLRAYRNRLYERTACR